MDEPTLRSADGYANLTSDCGDHLEFFIKVKNGRIAAVDFVLNACSITAACAKAAALLANGKLISQARKDAAPNKIVELLHLTPEQAHSAEFVYRVLRDALTDAAKTTIEPWRKLYRTKSVS